jgi:hypothetical protein
MMMSMSSPPEEFVVPPHHGGPSYGSGGGLQMMGSPVMPQSPPALLPTSPASPLTSGPDFCSPHAKMAADPFLDNNPGYYRHTAHQMPPAPPPLVWEPELAIQPHPPAYDECYSHPPASSSLYGQDLRFSYNNYN